MTTTGNNNNINNNNNNNGRFVPSNPTIARIINNNDPTIARMNDSIGSTGVGGAAGGAPQQQRPIPSALPTPVTRTNNNNNLTGSPPPPPPPDFVVNPWLGERGGGGMTTTTTTTNNVDWNDTQAMWRERERRQRTVRFLMMFLLMLLLMDGEEQQQRERQRQERYGDNNNSNNNNLRGSNRNYNGSSTTTKGSNNHQHHHRHHPFMFDSSPQLYHARRMQDTAIMDQLKSHPRYVHLMLDKNHGNDVDTDIRDWSEQRLDLERDEFDSAAAGLSLATGSIGGQGGDPTAAAGAVVPSPDMLIGNKGGGGAINGIGGNPLDGSGLAITTTVNTLDGGKTNGIVDPMEEKKVWHYPWNATGFYRGDWTMVELTSTTATSTTGQRKNIDDVLPTTTGNGRDNNNNNNNSKRPSSLTTLASSSLRDTETEVAIGTKNMKILHPTEMEEIMLEILQRQEDPTMGVHLLPPGIELQLPNVSSSTSTTTTSPTTESTTISVEGGEGDGTTTADSLAAATSRRMRNGGSGSAHQSPILRGATSTSTGRGQNDDKTTMGGSNEGNNSNNKNNVNDVANREAKITLTKSSGRAAFQLYSRTVPAMKEISIIDGFVKLYDSSTVGYSTRRDILLRVHGVLIHSIGRISLVANTHSAGRAALVIRGTGSGPDDSGGGRASGTSRGSSTSSSSTNEGRVDKKKAEGRRRRLLERIPDVGGGTISEEDLLKIRDDALTLFYDDSLLGTPAQRIYSLDEDELESMMDGAVLSQDSRRQEERRRLDEGAPDEGGSTTDVEASKKINEAILESTVGKEDIQDSTATASNSNITMAATNDPAAVYSKFVIPYPFAWDDEELSLQLNRIPSTVRSMPPREQLLEANAGSCEFEINMVVQEEEWTIGQWRNLMVKHMSQISQLDPDNRRNQILVQELDIDEEIARTSNNRRNRKKKKKGSKSLSKSSRAALEQALIMTINGTITSVNCGFAAHINATAIRTDWEHTTGKAINYSFYMMLTCLTQIVLLLRQLLHTQSQSAATRVSLLCIGWQTVVDALMCIVHIYLSLAFQPLFTAFASVAFFKLLIFCVIEMKYMAIIIQARNASNGGNTIDLLRRQIGMLHVRFYVALMASFLGFFYSGETYRTAYILLLYSFWVPQIIHNVVTEAKRPLHPYYVHGMSLTRLVAPIYIFAFQNNFLKEVYPESPTNVWMCQLLILWVGFQAGILEAQGRYGARFMIPARFLPPKFDYNRPIPASLLPRGYHPSSPSEELQNERQSPTTEIRSLVVPKREASPRGGGTRNRIKKQSNRCEGSMTAETVTAPPKNPDMPCFDCVICYNEIDIANRTGYMLAPCDHIFHKDCLVQWMEVKMECPICRTSLPAL